jgi:hypothetical protein
VAVVHAGVHDRVARQADVVGDRGRDRADLAVDRDERWKARRVDTRHAHEVGVVLGDTDLLVVAQLRREHRALRRGDASRETRVHEVHRLEVRRGARVHGGLVELEREDVAERQAGADGRDAVALDERHERVGLALHDRPRRRGAALVPVEHHRRDRIRVRVDGDDRRVLAADADRLHAARGVGRGARE